MPPQPLPDLSRDRQCYHYQAPAGQRCGSPAMKNDYYCYFHQVKQNKRINSRVLIDPEITRLELPIIEDRNSIFVAIATVIHRLGENTIDTRRAGQMLYGLALGLRALEPARDAAGKSEIATGSSDSHPQQGATQSCRSPHSETAASQASDDPQPAQALKTMQITKEGLLHFLRSRHCANCNHELFPAHELTERAHPGANPEIIEEARSGPASLDQIRDMLTGNIPRLQAVAASEQSPHLHHAHQGVHPIDFTMAPDQDLPHPCHSERREESPYFFFSAACARTIFPSSPLPPPPNCFTLS